MFSILRNCFPKFLRHFTFPAAMHRAPLFHILDNAFKFLFSWYLWSCVSLWFWFVFPYALIMMNICIYFLAIFIFSWEKYLFNSFTYFSWIILLYISKFNYFIHLLSLSKELPISFEHLARVRWMTWKVICLFLWIEVSCSWSCPLY